jgi:hypothetical protein
MSVSPAYIAFKMACEISPIILTGGIATALGGAIPIVALTETPLGILSGIASAGSNPLAGALNSLVAGTSGAGIDQTLDNFFARYVPVTGGSLIKNQVATYPFANQAVAANAIIAQPLNISMKMLCPVNTIAGYPIKLATITALQATLAQHNNQGGLYSVVTPSFIYTNCILTDMRDVSSGETRQAQYAWQLDFFQPLVTLQAATQALNGLMQTLTNGTAVNGTPGAATGLSIGNPTSAISNVVPSSPLGPI